MYYPAAPLAAQLNMYRAGGVLIQTPTTPSTPPPARSKRPEHRFLDELVLEILLLNAVLEKQRLLTVWDGISFPLPCLTSADTQLAGLLDEQKSYFDWISSWPEIPARNSVLVANCFCDKQLKVSITRGNNLVKSTKRYQISNGGT